MSRKFNLLLIIGLSLLNSPLHSTEISKSKDSLSSSIQEIAEDMKHLNSNLELLSNTISNLVP